MNNGISRRFISLVLTMSMIGALLTCALPVAAEGGSGGSTRNDLIGDIIVTTTADNGTGSLRQAIAEATDGKVITFDSSLFNDAANNPIEITLDSGELAYSNKAITIHGRVDQNGKPLVVLNGNNQSRVLNNQGAGTLTLYGLEIKNGSFPDGYGGGIYAKGSVDASNCVFRENSGWVSGGLYCEGNITAAHCIFDNNSTTSRGGGFSCLGDVTVTYCTFTNNTAPKNNGGGFTANGLVQADNCIFTDNVAKHASALESYGKATLTNCRINNNTSTEGATTNFAGDTIIINTVFTANNVSSSTVYGEKGKRMMLIHSTIADSNGYGIYPAGLNPYTFNSIIVGNAGGDIIGGSYTGDSIVSKDSAVRDRVFGSGRDYPDGYLPILPGGDADLTASPVTKSTLKNAGLTDSEATDILTLLAADLLGNPRSVVTVLPVSYGAVENALPAINSLEIDAPPSKTKYNLLDTPDYTGGTLKVSYGTDNSLLISMTDDAVTISHPLPDMTTAGTKEVFFEFMGVRTTVPLELTVHQGSTTAIVETDPVLTIHGNDFTLKITLKGPDGAAVPTGSISYKDHLGNDQQAHLVNGTVSLLMDHPNAKTAGVHSFSFTYSGDTNYKAKDYEEAYTVEKLQPALTLEPIIESGKYPAKFTLKATLTGADDNSNQTIIFKHEDWQVSAVTDSNGIATTAIEGWGAYTYNFSAEFKGDAKNYSTASSKCIVTIGRADQVLKFDKPDPAPETYSGNNYSFTNVARLVDEQGSRENVFHYEFVTPGTTGAASIDPTAGRISKVTKAGTFVVRATRPGDQNYADTSIEYTLVINKNADTAPVINPMENKTYGDGNFFMEASHISGGTITWQSSNNSIAEIDSGTGEVTIKSAGSVTFTATLEENDLYEQQSAAYTLDIARKKAYIHGVTVSNKVYDGTTNAHIDTSGAYTPDIINNDDVRIVPGTASYINKAVGSNKTVTFYGFTLDGAAADNYMIYPPAQTVADITPKELTIEVTVKDKAYDGLNTAELDAVLVGSVSNDHVRLTYGTAVFNEIVAGTHPVTLTPDFSITGSDAGNYTLIRPIGITGTILPGFTPEQDTHYTVSVPDGNDGWHRTDDFVISALSGYKISLDNQDTSDWTDSLRYSDEADEDEITFYVRNESTLEISVAETVSYKLDKTAPEGKIIIKSSSFSSFLNTITFGLFFKDTVTVEITAEDSLSGIDKIEYQQVETQSDYDQNGSWTASKSFSAEPNKIFIVFAKITDKAGNISIINSEGVVVYTDSEQDTDSILFTKTSADDVEAKVVLNGNTIHKIENSSNGALVKDTDYTIDHDTGIITFKASYLDSLAAGDYTLTVSFLPLGHAYISGTDNESPAEVSIALSVVKAVPKELIITGVPETVTYGDTSFDLGIAGGSNSGPVIWSSNNTKTAAVDPVTGKVIIKGAGLVTFTATVEENDWYQQQSAAYTLTIQQKYVPILGISVSNKVYDGTTKVNFNSSDAYIDTIYNDNVNVDSGTASYSDKHVGDNKTVTFSGFTLTGPDAGNYKTSQPAQMAADITPRELSMDVTVKDKAYDGLNTAELNAELIGKVSGDDVELTYGTAVFDNTDAGTQTVTLTQDFSITGNDADNYTLTQPANITGRILPGFTPEQDTHYTVSAPDGSNGWHKTDDFVISAMPGYKVSVNNQDDSDWKDFLDYPYETGGATITFYIRNAVTLEISAAGTENYKLDKTAPVGEITIKSNSFKSFLNMITFGLFFKETVTVEIAAEDQLSGVDEIAYQQVESQSDYDQNGSWTAGQKFSVEPNESFITFAKITDVAGNVTIINSEGIVVYTDSEQDTDAILFTKTSADDVEAKIVLNENTINKIENSNGETLVQDTDYTIDHDTGIITFKASYFDSLTAGDYTLTVSFFPLGHTYISGTENEAPAEVTIALSVVKAVPAELRIEGVPATVTYGDDSFDLTTAGGSNSGPVIWSSSNPEVAAVDPLEGTVTIKGTGSVTFTATVEETDFYKEQSAAYTLTVQQKPVSILGVSVSNKVYDGTTNVAFNPNGAYIDTVNDDSVEIIPGTASYSDKQVGTNKTVTFSGFALDGPKASNYKASQPAEITADIMPKELKVEVTVKDKPYDGLHAAELDAVLNGIVSGDHVILNDGTAEFEHPDTGKHKVILTQDFSITGDDASNYTLIQPDNITGSILPGFTPDQDTHYTVSVPDGTNDWYRTDDFVISAMPGYKVSLHNEDNSDWTDSLVYPAETDGTTITFYIRDVATLEISVFRTANYKLDKTAPVGEITIKSNSFKSFLNTITFGLFFKDTMTVEIDAEDQLSGVDKIEYQKVKTQSDYDQNGSWTTSKKFSVEPNESFITFAKITDVAGNVTIINSEGVVVYTDSAPDTERITFTKTSVDNVEAKVVLNGNIIDKIVNSSGGTLVKDTDYTVDNNTGIITFMASYLDSLTAGDSSLTVSFHPFGYEYISNTDNEAPAEVTIALTVKKAGQATLSIPEGDLIRELPDAAVQLTFNGGSGNGAITWSSSNEAVAQVDNNGLVTFTGKGTASITVTKAADNNYLEMISASITLSVVDKSELRELIETAKVIKDSAVAGDVTGQYPQSAIDVLDAAIAQAESIRDNTQAVQSDIDQMVTDLQDAINALKASQVNVDYSALRQLLETAKAEKDWSQYPVSAIGALQDAIDAAQLAADNDKLSQKAVDDAYSILQKALDDFYAAKIPIVDTSKLINKIKDSEDLLAAAVIGNEENQYPQKAADALQDAINKAQKILTDTNASQEDVNKAVEELDNAIEIFKSSANGPAKPAPVKPDRSKPNPPTGDEHPIWLYVLVLLASIGVSILILAKKKKSGTYNQ